MTRSALGAIAAVGSIWSMVSSRTTSSRPVGRGASRRWARTMMRLACALVSRCTATGRTLAAGGQRRPPASIRPSTFSVNRCSDGRTLLWAPSLEPPGASVHDQSIVPVAHTSAPEWAR